jgi:nucleoid DNA-binding protein
MSDDEIIAEVARAAGVYQREAKKVIETFLSVLRDEVWQRGHVTIHEFGRFEVKRRKARVCIPPPSAKTEVVRIAGHDAVTFRAAKNWRKR